MTNNADLFSQPYSFYVCHIMKILGKFVCHHTIMTIRFDFLANIFIVLYNYINSILIWGSISYQDIFWDFGRFFFPDTDCRSPCPEDQFQCSNGCCVKKESDCDDKMQCKDGYDDANCTKCEIFNSIILDTWWHEVLQKILFFRECKLIPASRH